MGTSALIFLLGCAPSVLTITGSVCGCVSPEPEKRSSISSLTFPAPLSFAGVQSQGLLLRRAAALPAEALCWLESNGSLGLVTSVQALWKVPAPLSLLSSLPDSLPRPVLPLLCSRVKAVSRKG